ncbi:caspase recruitment domain-containing protein 19-like isoform X1 [Synchiropus splendidus]|uniref:caspase recruitment domain-containing protein 19-like isoform X1 n=2 Tax=Synchiropus splendidus TaxID=270530 RepID=UPI00237ED352|nr:caspase recruitment domain-containing protein 19-like isoform X1 [Synchiropus splendidus]XP_053705370.1 caspase recruitment domain-containing protein 19-like isoform X1 [Synchiropus splendidus]
MSPQFGGRLKCLSRPEVSSYHEQLRRDFLFLCSDGRLDSEMVDTLVLQLNRIYPQILSDKEAQRFRSLTVPSKVRLAEMLSHLHWKGEEACHEFYRGLHIHAENIYCNLPSRLRLKETAAEPDTYSHREKSRGPLFFLSCFTFVLATAILYYSGDDERFKSTGLFLHCSAARLSKGSKKVFIYYSDA